MIEQNSQSMQITAASPQAELIQKALDSIELNVTKQKTQSKGRLVGKLGVATYTMPILAKAYNELQSDPKKYILIQSPLRKFKAVLKKHRVFMKCNPIFREHVLKEPQSQYFTLGLGQELKHAYSLKETDYIFVISGALQIVCEKLCPN